MASTASLHKNRKSTLARIKRFLAKDDSFSTSANQIIMKSDDSIYSKMYSASTPARCMVRQTSCHSESQEIMQKENLNPNSTPLFQPAQIGDEFGPTWSTHLFKVSVQIPTDWHGKHIHLRWNSSSEAMLLDQSGSVLQGFIPKHREFYTLAESWQFVDPKEIIFYIEMACNGLFGALGEGFSIDPPVLDLKYKLKMADVAVFEPLVFQLYTDLEVLLGIAEELAEDIRGFQALYTANEMINLIIAQGHEKAKTIAANFFSEGNGAKAHTLIAMGHCHIDTAWLWTYSETKRKCARSWSSQIELMKQYPDMVFTCSQMQQIAWMKEEYPSLYNNIKEFVALNRFIPVGGTWVEMDGLIPDGESFIRQFFYGQRFLEKEFGLKAKEFWLPDTFGYSGQIPQILTHVGLQRFLTQKISWNRVNKFPHHSFWWEGIDGSKVLAHFPPGDSYEMNGFVKEVLKSVNNSEDKGRTNIGAYLYGLGDGGGGPTVPIVERLQRLKNVDGLPKIVHEGPDYFFTKLEADAHKLCKWVGELYLEMHNGTYTSQANLKWYNRKLERLLRTAELKSTFNKLVGGLANSTEAIRLIDNCWEGILLNQFHDVIPGSCIEQVVTDALDIYQRAFAKLTAFNFEQAALLGLKTLACSDAEQQIVGFNPLPWGVSGVLSIPINEIPKDHQFDSKMFQYVELEGFPDLQDHFNKNYPLWTFGNPNRFIACFSELQPSGYSKLTPKQSNNPVKFSKSADGSTGVFSNGIIRLEFSLTGLPGEKLFKLTSNGNSTSEWEVFAGNKDSEAGMFYIFDDHPFSWDAWDCDDYHLETKQSILSCGNAGAIEVVAEGPIIGIYRWKVTATGNATGGNSLPITRYTIIKAGSPLVEYVTIVDWSQQAHKFLKVEFPVNVFAREATYEIQYGNIKRPTHSNTSWDMAQIETSGHKWVDLSQQDRGVSLINDSKYGFRIKDNIVQLSLLRAPKAPDGNCDMHQHVVKYAILPHEGSFHESGTVRHAYEINTHFEFYGVSEQTPVASLPVQIITTSHESIIPEVVKLAHDNRDNAICVRLYESFGGSPSNVTVTVQFPVKKVVECDGMEIPVLPAQDYPIAREEKISIGADKSMFCSFDVDFRPFQIRSFLLYL